MQEVSLGMGRCPLWVIPRLWLPSQDLGFDSDQCAPNHSRWR